MDEVQYALALTVAVSELALQADAFNAPLQRTLCAFGNMALAQAELEEACTADEAV